MKKYFISVFAVFCFFALVASPVIAKDYTNEPAVSEPVLDGDDVIFSDTDMRAIPDYTGDNVYIRAHDASDVWGYIIEREGQNNWRAIGVRGIDIHPYVGDRFGDYKPGTNFIKAEKYYGRPYYKIRPMGPCFHFE